MAMTVEEFTAAMKKADLILFERIIAAYEKSRKATS